MHLSQAAQREESAVTLLAVLRAEGGVAQRSVLVSATSRATVEHAIATGAVTMLRRGLLALPELDRAVAVAHAAGGVLSLTSAALFHGWAVKTVPERPHITVTKGRRVPAEIARETVLHRAALGLGQVVDGIATDKELTLAQCARLLPFDEALAVADSALRDGEIDLVRRVGREARGPGAPTIRRVMAAATGLAANPFESVLRAICLGVPGLTVRPQVLITEVMPWARPDLVDEELRIVIEADSFEWHGGRSQLRRDAQRYNDLVVAGWIVLRFPYEDVMFHPDAVRAILARVVERAQEHTEVEPRPRLTLVPGGRRSS